MSAPDGIFLGRLSTPALGNLPPAGELYFYVDSSDDNFKQIDSAGTVTNLSDSGIEGVAHRFNKQQTIVTGTLTDAASISWDLDDDQVATVTLGGNRTLANPSNMQDGGTYIVIVKQDGTGSRTLGYGSAYKWTVGIAPTLTTTASATDILTFVSDGTNMFGVEKLDFS